MAHPLHSYATSLREMQKWMGYMVENGYFKIAMPLSHQIEELNWTNKVGISSNPF